MTEYRIVGGHPAIDLVNTVEPRFPVPLPKDHLGSSSDLLSWALRAGALGEDEAGEVREAWRRRPGKAAEAVRVAVEIREATYAVLLGVLRGNMDDCAEPLERLTARWIAATARSSLVAREAGADWSAGGPPVRAQLVGAPATLLPDRLALNAADLLRTLERDQLKECPADEGGCGWLFLDRSRNGSRRWCAMEDCGAQAKARRLTARRRASR